MSRIGKVPIVVPQEVEVKIKDSILEIKGPKGQLSQPFNTQVSVEYDPKGRLLRVKTSSPSDHGQNTLQGLTRALIANAVEGVSRGFSKGLEIHGLGYSAKVQGKDLVLSVGHTKPLHLKIPDGITVEVSQPTNPAKFTLKGADKHLVGQFAAVIRGVRPVEPYKGKGVRYSDEVVRKKAGKAFAAAAQQ